MAVRSPNAGCGRDEGGEDCEGAEPNGLDDGFRNGGAGVVAFFFWDRGLFGWSAGEERGSRTDRVCGGCEPDQPRLGDGVAALSSPTLVAGHAECGLQNA